MMNLCKEENLGEFSVALALGILIDDDFLKYRMTDLFIKFIQESGREKDLSDADSNVIAVLSVLKKGLILYV
jgi:hypothetical protein